ncbi:hypothetical protein BJY00DRAFT_282198 [Aspergillus carlsbadensis]|nr:hypothetical protein BJY00DRAFT_282198 [Aspergillus carlsbadensis]
MRIRAFLSASLLPLVVASPALATAYPPTHTTIPAGQVIGPATADTTVGQSPFGGSHITAHNGSAYEWWYFDVVSRDSSAAVVIQFYPAWFADSNAILLNIAGAPENDKTGDRDENNTNTNTLLIRERIPAGALELSTLGDGSQGYVADGAMTWVGAPDLSVYHVTLDVNVEGIRVTGTISMRSRAPAHVACGLNERGNTFDAARFFLWANAIPDAEAVVHLTVNGEQFAFVGSGYHDQNWGLGAFVQDLTQWYWGHFTAGRYSVVYGYYWDASWVIHSSIYLAENGTPIVYGCSDGLVEVTARGPGVSVPVVNLEEVEGWDIQIDDPEEGKFAFYIENTLTAVRGDPTVTRFVGKVTGGRVGEVNSTGPALVELMGNLWHGSGER